jgi:hypothetical protein
MTDEWRSQAACIGAPIAAFYPPGSKPNYRHARNAYCKRCEVVAQCLTDALVTESVIGGRHGLWGGKTPDERAAMVKR